MGTAMLCAHGELEYQASAPSRGDVLARYRRLREISKRHHSEVLNFLPRHAVLDQARRLGLAVGRTILLDNMDEITLAFDLAIHTSPAGRSRAIDRYARSTAFPQGSDEALVLDAMRGACFAIIIVKDRHPAAGLLVTDVFRESDLWLVDEGLEMSLPKGAACATRYCKPEDFAMTAGVCVPLDLVLLGTIVAAVPQLLSKALGEVVGDRRFAEAVYRAAIADGTTEMVSYQDPGDAA